MDVQHPDTSDARRWVIGLDGSECSRHAAVWAASHAVGRVTELELAMSWRLPVAATMTPMGSPLGGFSADLLDTSAHQTVEHVARQIRPGLTVPVVSSVCQGGAASTLIDAAVGADLLVVGSRGRGGFARLLLGSTSTQCATHASVPVAVIPASASTSPTRVIVVAFDGSANSIAALRWAHRFAAPDSTIECVSVWDTAPIMAGADQFFFPEASELAEQRFEHLVDSTVESIARDDIDVRRHFMSGPTRSTIADAASDGDLLVMGARGHGAIGAAILGSTSTWLLHHFTAPMVVVPHEFDHRAHHEPVVDTTLPDERE